MSHPDNELRRRLWALADKWEAEDHVEPGSYFAAKLREELTYPLADASAEEALKRIFGKSSDELADEAERGYS